MYLYRKDVDCEKLYWKKKYLRQLFKVLRLDLLIYILSFKIEQTFFPCVRLWYCSIMTSLTRVYCQIIMYHLNQLFWGWWSDYKKLAMRHMVLKCCSLTWPSHFLISEISIGSRWQESCICNCGFFSWRRELVDSAKLYNFNEIQYYYCTKSWDKCFCLDNLKVDYWVLYNTVWSVKFLWTHIIWVYQRQENFSCRWNLTSDFLIGAYLFRD